ncbi:MAG: hypothetical protein EB127_13310 [Alphaproteobacteria bacterium]|nr:hypothetical protein [Alphaproteobacteria bacterium]
MLNNWEPFTVISAGEFKNSNGETEQFYRVVLQVSGFQTIEHFEGTFQECQNECHELNMRIQASVSQHIMNGIKEQTKDINLIPYDPLKWEGRKNEKDQEVE